MVGSPEGRLQGSPLRQRFPKLLQFAGLHTITMLRARECPVLYVFPVRGKGFLHRSRQLCVPFDELGFDVANEGTEDIVGDHELSVYVRSGADAVNRDLHRVANVRRGLGRHSLDEDRKRSREFKRSCIIGQMFSGVQKVRPDGMKTRGDIHILLIGDPGAAKSQMLKYVSALAPKGRYVVGKSSSGAGLTAAAVKDEFTGTWALEAGALVLANGGMCAIDEMDKMDATDRSSMHEVMEQQTVTVSKASIQATLSARTIILAAANPKYGRFDPYTPIPDQINLPDTLISRFDLIFAIRDIPSREKDTSLAEHILSLHENPEEENVPMSAEMLRKYIAYARTNCAPKLTKGAIEVIREFYVNIRNQNSEDEKAPIPLTARQLEALVRLAEASAKIRLSDTVTKADATRGIDLLTHCLKQVGIDPETGQFDIDRLSSGVTSSKRNKIMNILRIIKEMQDESPDKLVNREDLISRAEEEGMDSAKVEEIIESLRRDGELFEPRHGFLKKV